MNKTMIKVLLLLITFSIFKSINAQPVTLEDIKNFNQVSKSLASAGMPSTSDLTLLNENGYQHVITLLPGNYQEEASTVEALGMSFDQIEVDWGNPKLKDFQRFVELMKKYKSDKSIVHCYLNYRASAFAYLYQVTQQGVSEEKAQGTMFKVWQPEDIWLSFINDVKAHYQN